jgi:hypothetical protein
MIKEKEKETKITPDEFIFLYRQNRECCPVCGGERYSSTLKSYFLDENNYENYKDENMCICITCNNNHMFHDRVPNKYIKILKTEYKKLIDNSTFLDCLESCGVDNWDGYSDAIKMFEE